MITRRLKESLSSTKYREAERFLAFEDVTDTNLDVAFGPVRQHLVNVASIMNRYEKTAAIKEKLAMYVA